MRITWVTRSFLDYRIPVFRELDRLCGGDLRVIYNREVISDQLTRKIESCLGDRAIGMAGELRLGGRKIDNESMANSGIRIPYQPGLLGEIARTEPAVMISDGFMQWTYGPLFRRVFHRTPHVMCYERTAFTERHCQWYRKLYRKIALHAIDAICVNGSLCADYVRGLGVAPENVLTGQMAADTDGMAAAVAAIPAAAAAAWRREHGIGKTMLLYVGQIIPRKGIRQLLAAWRQCGSAPDCSLVLVGGGREEEELKAWCAANALTNVHWLGRQPYDSIALYYRAADIFIIPTLEDNWSLVVPEAMASGLPVACSIYNGCHPELVRPENGWTFDPLNLEATAAMLRQIINSRDSLAPMGGASRRIVAEYTPKHAAEAIFQACHRAANKDYNRS